VIRGSKWLESHPPKIKEQSRMWSSLKHVIQSGMVIELRLIYFLDTCWIKYMPTDRKRKEKKTTISVRQYLITRFYGSFCYR
jgi:hypothetical protein